VVNNTLINIMQCCARAILAIKNPGHEPGIIIDSQLHSEIHNHFLAYIKDHYMPEIDTHNNPTGAFQLHSN
jgi:hypothetical protein